MAAGAAVAVGGTWVGTTGMLVLVGAGRVGKAVGTVVGLTVGLAIAGDAFMPGGVDVVEGALVGVALGALVEDGMAVLVGRAISIARWSVYTVAVVVGVGSVGSATRVCLLGDEWVRRPGGFRCSR